MNGPAATMTSVEHPAGHTEPVDEIPVLELVVPFQGFPDHRRFALTRLDEQGLMCALRSMEDPDLRFVVVPPALFFDDYAPQVDDSLVQTLEAGSADEWIVKPFDMISLVQKARQVLASQMAA